MYQKKVAIDPSQVEQTRYIYGERIVHMMTIGNWEAVRRVVDEAERASKSQQLKPLLDVSIQDACEHIRTANSLESIGVETIGDLTETTTAALLATRNMGPGSIDMIWWSVLKLATERDDLRALQE